MYSDAKVIQNPPTTKQNTPKLRFFISKRYILFRFNVLMPVFEFILSEKMEQINPSNTFVAASSMPFNLIAITM